MSSLSSPDSETVRGRIELIISSLRSAAAGVKEAESQLEKLDYIDHGSLYREQVLLLRTETQAISRRLLSLYRRQRSLFPMPLSEYDWLPTLHLDTSSRTYNVLHRNGIDRVSDLTKLTWRDLMRMRGFGPQTRVELEEKLASLSIELRRR